MIGVVLLSAVIGRAGEDLTTGQSSYLQTVADLSTLGDRSSGTEGNRRAADYIKRRFEALGLDPATHQFAMPVRSFRKSRLFIPAINRSFPIRPLVLNAVAVEAVRPEGVAGPLVYVGKGRLADFNQQDIDGAVVLMDLDSGKNWMNAAALGAAALIFVDHGVAGGPKWAPSPRFFFEEKLELTPLRFPRFWIPAEDLALLLQPKGSLPPGPIAKDVEIMAEMSWQRSIGENVYCLLPGKEGPLKDELMIVEAFYDSSAFIADRSPGADEALGVATLISLAEKLVQNPPGRSVLLVATTGHSQSLTGMRELVWSIRVRGRDLRQMKRTLKGTIKEADAQVKLLEECLANRAEPETRYMGLKPALEESIKSEVDRLSRRLIQIRLSAASGNRESDLQALAQKRARLRQLTWREDYGSLSAEERSLLETIIPQALKIHRTVYREAVQDQKLLKSAQQFRKRVKEKELTAIFSLHLSSHGDGIGAFNQGFQYPLTSRINRVAAYSKMDDAIKHSAKEAEQSLGAPSLLHDTLRPSRLRSWQSHFIDRPSLGGEVSALAGYLGVSLVTVNDARPFWGTPNDLPTNLNPIYATGQNAFACSVLENVTRTPQLHGQAFPRDGFSMVKGRASFLRHGELFADQAAPGTVVMAFQGPARYYAMANSRGQFQFKGIADKKHVLSKLIMEGYRFDSATGRIVWAIDKKRTGKAAYRLKMQRRYMETDLIMFACDQTTLFNLLEPRSFQYMTKIQLIDGVREAPPLKYWYSRIDTRESILSSIFLESQTRLKMTLSDSIVRKKLILTGATEEHPAGLGYLIEKTPFIHNTPYRVAKDMWALLEPRIESLETHGIYDERLRDLQKEGGKALQQADAWLSDKKYDAFSEATAKAWALASRVYDQVEATQKDVLFGVLFYIALFVPFAFCSERLLFAYTDINKRILAFCGILLLLIAVIYYVHPAFQLAYSPLVVVLAFFIIGLSVLVTMIIFLRFEEEMVQLQRRASHISLAEISRWKAFTAAFFLGVSNLRRRRLRTALTCMTLIILTFTIMSFTTVKTVRQQAKVLYQRTTPYVGILLKNVNWKSLPAQAFGTIANAFNPQDFVAPRVWLLTDDQTQAVRVPVRYKEKKNEARGLVGLSASEAAVSGIEKILISGRWLKAGDRQVVLLPDQMARSLGIDVSLAENPSVRLWGMPFAVIGIFSGTKLQSQADLDGEELTPVTFPREVVTEMTEVEVEAFESGDDVKTFQSRYQHVPGNQTLIMPYQTLLAAGGQLKSVAVRLGSKTADIASVAGRMVDRFGLSLFSGEEKGTFLYQASDTLSYSGVPNIIIPLIISIFIVLNTMIGSVYERKREIGIYTSVGLAPSHVSFLFIAESLAFAVLSVVSGYVLAQVSASILAGSELFAGITVNYSSLSGVAAMVLVILVVLISAIYPSKVAADLAIPDVNRSWKMPDSKENIITLTLPFMLKFSELNGVAGYLFSYFKAHQDVSHGIFSTGNVKIVRSCPQHRRDWILPIRDVTVSCQDKSCLQIQLNVWLAPFDFGIMQLVDLNICPAREDASFLEIRVQLRRRSGEMNAWWRVNKVFLNNLRKQMLIWRSLDAGKQREYEKQVMSIGYD